MFAAVVLVATMAGDLPHSRCVPRPDMTVEALLEIWGRCGNADELEEAIGRRGETAVPDLLAVYHKRPELRSAVFETMWSMGPSGHEAFKQLGRDGVRALASVGARHKDELLRSLGPQGTAILLEMLEGPDRDLRRFAWLSLQTIVPAEALDMFLRAMESDRDETTRVEAARAAAQIDPKRAIPGMLRLLQDQALAPQSRASMARRLAGIDDPRAFDAVVALLADAHVERSLRWDIALDLNKTGRPEAAAAAKRYGPSGRQGSGTPDSSTGALLTVLLFGFACALVVCARDAVPRGTRLILLLAASGGTYAAAFVVGGFLPMIIAGMIFRTGGRVTGGFFLPPWLLAAVVAVLLWASASLAVALFRGAHGQAVSAMAMGGMTALAFLAGAVVDAKVYWYLQRMIDPGPPGSIFQSLLVLAVTTTGAAVGSYLRMPAKAA